MVWRKDVLYVMSKGEIAGMWKDGVEPARSKGGQGEVGRGGRSSRQGQRQVRERQGGQGKGRRRWE